MRAIAAIAFAIGILASSRCQCEPAASVWKAFAAKNKVMRWVGREFLVGNPYKYADKVIAFQAWFVGSTDTEAIFSDRFGGLDQAIAASYDTLRPLKRGDAVVVAVHVSGASAGPETNLTLVDVYLCTNRKAACADFAKFNTSGELLIPERRLPLPLVTERDGALDEQNNGAFEGKNGN
jgi:hypothetical protein